MMAATETANSDRKLLKIEGDLYLLVGPHGQYRDELTPSEEKLLYAARTLVNQVINAREKFDKRWGEK